MKTLFYITLLLPIFLSGIAFSYLAIDAINKQNGDIEFILITYFFIVMVLIERVLCITDEIKRKRNASTID